MRRGRKSTSSFKSFEERIEILKKEVLLLEELALLHEYFKLIIRYQNSYVVEIRRIIAVDLINRGVSNSEIGRALARNHATILHLVKIENHVEIQEIVRDNYKEWMANKLCPITYTRIVPSAHHPTGYKSYTDYSLKQLE